MSDHHVGISVEQFETCDQSFDCFSGFQSQSDSLVAPTPRTTDECTVSLSQAWLRKGHLVIHKCAHSLSSILRVHGSHESIVVAGEVETGTEVGADFHHLVAEQLNGRLLGETCDSSLGLERMSRGADGRMQRNSRHGLDHTGH